MTQERVANSVCKRHLNFVLYNTPFAASIDNPTIGLPTECESFYGGTGSFRDRGPGTTENSALLAYFASEAYKP